MKKFEQYKVCLLMNLGGFEERVEENLEAARTYGKTVYAMTGDGLVNVEETSLIPVNVLDLTSAELFIWSSIINEQLQENFLKEDVVILAVGRKHRGLLPLGTPIGQNVRIGA
ncbi:hypothetical protein QYF50_06500 [Paenibacillus vini]|uniref:hypothetical protein n=1 Tax=Paenibacillus vini TaxID=1476024 RepID=UPI0025B6C596|nr:hypothetical protein [Paenibacillus vini]MDN4067541.1 hypothetical protein [Paenibacillus vini]